MDLGGQSHLALGWNHGVPSKRLGNSSLPIVRRRPGGAKTSRIAEGFQQIVDHFYHEKRLLHTGSQQGHERFPAMKLVKLCCHKKSHQKQTADTDLPNTTPILAEKLFYHEEDWEKIALILLRVVRRGSIVVVMFINHEELARVENEATRGPLSCGKVVLHTGEASCRHYCHASRKMSWSA